MPVPPVLLAVPAVAASLAYFNGRTQIFYDVALLKALFAIRLHIGREEKRDRINAYYTLEDHALSKTQADRPFLIFQGSTWTYNETYQIVLKYGAWLKDTYGIAPKEVVALDSMNSPEFVFLLLAIWSIGASPALINYNLTGQSLVHCIKVATARVVLVDEEIRPQFSPEVQDALSSPNALDRKGPIQIQYITKALQQQVLASNGPRQPDSLRSGPKRIDMSMLIFTSGTTGLPKAAIVPWHKIHSGKDILAHWMGWKREDRYYTCMPLYHATATILGLFPALGIGSTLILGRRFSNTTFWPEVRSSNATIINYVGETCRYLLSAPPQIDPLTGSNLDKSHSVRIAFGNGLRPDVWNRFKERFGIETVGEFYSATESTSASWNLSSNDFSAGAIGRNGSLLGLLLGSTVAIVEIDWEAEAPARSVPDPGSKANGKQSQAQAFCKKVPRGQAGELLYKVDVANLHEKYVGYFNNAKASDSKIWRDVFSIGDAWFRSGDVVRWDGEGRWWFVDRLGDTYRWKSENISTMEVAEVLGRCAGVQEANVYGVLVPQHDGRAGCAAILIDRDREESRVLGSLAAHVAAQLPRYAQPVFLRVTDVTQATGNNKQQKHLLRAEGVEPGKVRGSTSSNKGDRLYWLKDGRYVAFGEGDWRSLEDGRVQL